jgi:hypothetical protein
VIQTDAQVLQKLLNKHLNVPLGGLADPADPWNVSFGTARQRTCTGVSAPQKLKYVVLKGLYGVVLNVLRYWRVDSDREPAKGYIAYTEVLIQFLVNRILAAEPKAPAETFYFLGVVYIDDSAFRGELQDPDTLPILIGREAFGLPKNPGQIYYCPDDSKNALGPQLNIWDYAATPAKLALQPAITVNPGSWKTPTSDYCPCDPTPPSENLTRYGPLAAQLRIQEEELQLRAFEDERDPFAKFARVLSLPDDKILELPTGQVVKEIVIRDDLHLFAKLVGLKQFPDPTSELPQGANATVDACYRAVVESSVEHLAFERPIPYAVVGKQEIEFHERNRVDLAGAFAIPLNPSRKVQVPDVNVHYMVSNFLFGRPCRTDVWEPA